MQWTIDTLNDIIGLMLKKATERLQAIQYVEYHFLKANHTVNINTSIRSRETKSSWKYYRLVAQRLIIIVYLHCDEQIPEINKTEV